MLKKGREFQNDSWAVFRNKQTTMKRISLFLLREAISLFQQMVFFYSKRGLYTEKKSDTNKPKKQPNNNKNNNNNSKA